MSDAGPGTRAAVPGGGEPAVECRRLTVAYAAEPIVREVDLTLGRGQTVALLGPSGSGKTTLLYALAGFIQPTGGEIHMGGRLVATAERSDPPEKRPLAMVFQHYGLWPHLDALETVAYPLRRAGLSSRESRRQAGQLLAQVRIDHLAERRPAELSGGEQQRVGLARALARRPHVYLLDEPTAHLDTALKSDLQAELTARLRSDGAAAIHATHDVEEALALADRVVLLRAGSIVQEGTPTSVYAQPVDRWAAHLTGPVTFLAGAVEAGAGGPVLLTSDHRLQLGPDAGIRPDVRPGQYMVRPDWVQLGGPLEASVREIWYRGTYTDYLLATPAGRLLVREPGPPRLALGETTSCRIRQAWRLGGDEDGQVEDGSVLGPTSAG